MSTASPEGESARFVVVFASIDGLKSSWPQPLIAGASKTAAEVTWSGCCQVVASIVVASGPSQAVGFESRARNGGGSGYGPGAGDPPPVNLSESWPGSPGTPQILTDEVRSPNDSLTPSRVAVSP